PHLPPALPSTGELFPASPVRVRLDDPLSGRLVGRHFDALAKVVGQGDLARLLARQAALTRQSLLGRELPLGFVHGDLNLGNVIMEADALARVIDWAHSAERHLP